MVTRKLSPNEETVCRKSLNLYEEAQRRMKIKLQELDFSIEYGVHNNYLDKLDELKQKKRELCAQILDLDVNIQSMQSKLPNVNDKDKPIMQKVIREQEQLRHRKQLKLQDVDFMISQGLHNNYLEKVDELKSKKRELTSEISNINLHIQTLQTHLNIGVEVKEQEPIRENLGDNNDTGRNNSASNC